MLVTVLGIVKEPVSPVQFKKPLMPMLTTEYVIKLLVTVLEIVNVPEIDVDVDATLTVDPVNTVYIKEPIVNVDIIIYTNIKYIAKKKIINSLHLLNTQFL